LPGNECLANTKLTQDLNNNTEANAAEVAHFLFEMYFPNTPKVPKGCAYLKPEPTNRKDSNRGLPLPVRLRGKHVIS
jgi:hypothetical protein